MRIGRVNPVTIWSGATTTVGKSKDEAAPSVQRGPKTRQPMAGLQSRSTPLSLDSVAPRVATESLESLTELPQRVKLVAKGPTAVKRKSKNKTAKAKKKRRTS